MVGQQSTSEKVLQMRISISELRNGLKPGRGSRDLEGSRDLGAMNRFA
jgi:hypothetical protein